MYYHAGHGFVPTIPINSNQQTPTFYLAFYVTYSLTCSDILSGIEAGEEAGTLAYDFSDLAGRRTKDEEEREVEIKSRDPRLADGEQS